MAELKRRDEELTTADLAGATEKRDPESRPQLVRSEQRSQVDSLTASASDAAYPSTDGRFANERSNLTSATDASVSGIDRTQAGTTTAAASDQPTALFSESEIGDFRSRWSGIQTGFVDEPRRAVEDADNLVASLMKKLAEGFANERAGLEHQWDRGDNVSTEDLRIALQRYRSFFDRLLKI